MKSKNEPVYFTLVQFSAVVVVAYISLSIFLHMQILVSVPMQTSVTAGMTVPVAETQ